MTKCPYMSYLRAGAAAVLAALAIAPGAEAYELQVAPKLTPGHTVAIHNATSYDSAVRFSMRVINRADAGVRLVPAASRRGAHIRIGYLRNGCRGTVRGEARRGELAIARGCSRAAARHAVLHEIGHALGLGHEDARCSVMNSWWVNGKPKRCARFSWRNPLQPDDVAGLRAIWRRSAAAAPQARIVARDTVVRAGEAIDFIDGSNGPGGWSAAWSFGDGSTAAGPAVRHAFAAPGSYLVRMEIEYDGRVSSVTQLVTVLP